MDIGEILDAALVVVVAASMLKTIGNRAVALRKRGLVDTHPNCDGFQNLAASPLITLFRHELLTITCVHQ